MIIQYKSINLARVLSHIDDAAQMQTITRNQGVWCITLTYGAL